MKEFYPEVYHPEKTKKNIADVDKKPAAAERKEMPKKSALHIFLLRHGKRPPNEIGSDAELTADGMQKCIELGKQIGKSPIIGGECSRPDKNTECVRTRQTAQCIACGSRAEDKRPIMGKEELSSHASKEYRNKVRNHVKETLKAKNPNLTDEELNKDDILSTIEGIDFYINSKDSDLDAQTYSPLETAARVAVRMSAAIEMIADLESEKAMDYLIVTHDYVIAAFLQQVLIWETKDGSTKRGFKSLAELGDKPIEFLETLEITVETNEKGERNISAGFRGKKCEIDMERLKELAEYGNYLKDAERIYALEK